METVDVRSNVIPIVVSPASPDVIVVRNVTQMLVVNPATASVKIVYSGPPGPQGPPGSGGGGGGGTGYVHTQSTPDTVWLINHDKGVKPLSVQLQSVGGVVMTGAIHNLNSNQTQVEFNTPVAGTASFVF